MDLSTVLRADPLSVEVLMTQPGRGFSIPSYQGAYAWGANKIDRLISLITEGVNNLADRTDGITFIGTIIFIHDTQHATVKPLVRDDLLSQVYLVIDGQQRLTTLVVLCVILHELLLTRAVRLQTHAGPELVAWVQGESQELTHRLARIFEHDSYSGAGTLRYYPRVIGGHEDSWSKSAAARYHSPVASYLFRYINGIHPGESVSTVLPTTVLPGEETEPHRKLKRAEKTIRRRLDALIRPRNGAKADAVLPEVPCILTNVEYQARLFRVELPPPVLVALSKPEERKKGSPLHEFARLSLFTRYLLERVSLMQMLVNKEEYAFEIMKVLNCSGSAIVRHRRSRP